MRLNRPLPARFETSYIPEPMSGCWLWTGKIDTGGYGVITENRKDLRAHRVSYSLVHGAMPPSSLDVCHRCDNRACVNPDHLFLGTRKDNIRDCWRKRRGVINARKATGGRPRELSSSEVLAIRARVAAGETQRVIAAAFGISGGHVSMIASRKLWAWLQ